MLIRRRAHAPLICYAERGALHACAMRVLTRYAIAIRARVFDTYMLCLITWRRARRALRSRRARHLSLSARAESAPRDAHTCYSLPLLIRPIAPYIEISLLCAARRACARVRYVICACEVLPRMIHATPYAAMPRCFIFAGLICCRLHVASLLFSLLPIT